MLPDTEDAALPVPGGVHGLVDDHVPMSGGS
jgi:hypothetical protein